METGNYYFSDTGFWFFVPERLAWEDVKKVMNDIKEFPVPKEDWKLEKIVFKKG